MASHQSKMPSNCE